MLYRKLKRTWSNGYANHIPNFKFKEIFPELSKIDNEELCSRFQKLNMEFYYEKKEPVILWIRLTLPFALILIVLMFLCLPINFMFTGHWGYKLGKNNYVFNWFKSLNLNT